VLWYPVWKNQFFYKFVKAFIILLILTESCWLYIQTNNFNDDTMHRPVLHGAYEVDQFIINGDTLAPLLTDTIRWKRVFIHRDDYFIIEKMNGKMEDHKMELDTAKNIIRLPQQQKNSADVEIHFYRADNGSLYIKTWFEEDTTKISLRPLEWQKLPALKNEFHWN
jgi:hypothetical protein